MARRTLFDYDFCRASSASKRDREHGDIEEYASSTKIVALGADSRNEFERSGTSVQKTKILRLDNIPNIVKQNQPSENFVFPVTNGRKCNIAWFSIFKWLHYDEGKDAVLCYQCVKACLIIEKSDTSWLSKGEETFLITGFRNWKKATEKFNIHAKSSFHRKNIELLFSRENQQPVNIQIGVAMQSDQQKSQKCLMVIISTLRYLARAGLAIRGHEHNTGNFFELLEERTIDVPELKQWLSRTNNFVSSDIQNEIIEIMAHMLLRDLVNEINASEYFSLIADGTTDSEGVEQYSICLRFVTPESLEIQEVFIGLYNPEDTTGKTLTAAIKDALLRLNISLTKLRANCFDGARNMSGKNKGVQKLLGDEQPKSLFIHCANHSADLALQEVAKINAGVCDILCLVKDSSNVILRSAKRQNIYANIIISPCNDANDSEQIGAARKKLVPLCPTRWCVRAKSLVRYKQQYEVVRETLQTILDEDKSISSETKSLIRGYLRKLYFFGTMFFLVVCIEIFGPCEQLAKSLQDPHFTATGAKQAVRILKKRIQDLRCDEEFEKMYDHVNELAIKFELVDPDHRTKKIPKRFEQTGSTTPTQSVTLTKKEKYRKDFFEVLDLLINELERRFDQKALETLEMLESILLDAYKGTVPTEEDLKVKLGRYDEDFETGDLRSQLSLLKNMPGPGVLPTCCAEICEQFRNMPSTMKNLLNEVVRLITLLLTVPASAASSERSFSALRRLKTCLRSTMTQKRLTHLILLHVHRDRTGNLDLLRIMKEFVSRGNRKITFGKIV